MSRDPVRVAIAVLCVVAIVVTSALLPLATVDSARLNNSSGSGNGFNVQNAGGLGGNLSESVAGGVVENATNSALDQAGILSAGNRASLGGPISNGSGPGALSAKVMFTVDAERPTYWREGAYVQYTGSGWTRPDDATTYSGTVMPTAEGDRFVQTVTVKAPMNVVPAAWQPSELRGDIAEVATTTERGGIRLTEPLQANDTYTVVSRVSRPSPATLRDAGTDYPSSIRDRYTALPDSVPDRVAEKTDSIVAGADTTYGKAKAIEGWLEANKNYSLDARKPAGDFVDTFVFEMDEGYCEYFATSMVVMLRTEGIPARYVTGFSPGQPAGDGTYTVRQMNAHAWVEVYFPGEGWVRFDPTPPTERLQSEEEALQQARSSGETDVDTAGTQNQTYDHVEETSPGEAANGTTDDVSDLPNGSDVNGTDGLNGSDDLNGSDGDGNVSDGDGDTDDGSDDGGDDTDDGTDDGDGDTDVGDGTSGDGGSALNVTVTPDPAPGKQVTVTVTRDGSPVPDVAVAFNGDRVGVTDANGQVVATVPYTRNLTISVRELSSSRLAAVPPPGDGTRMYALAAPPPTAVAATTDADRPPDNESNESSRTYELDTDAEVSVDGDQRVGARVTVTATVDGTPLRNANVTVDGRFVGRTDDAGTIALTLPYEPETTLAVTRGDVVGTTTLDLNASVDVSVRGSLVPNETVAVVATVGGEPLSGAPVYVNGTQVARTDANGTARVTVPYRDPVAFRVGRDGANATVVEALDETLSVAVDGHRYPGATLTLTVTLNGTPVEDAVVKRGNETVAVTDANGEATVDARFTNAMTVAVTKGDVTVDRRVGWILLPVYALVAVGLLLAGLAVARRYFGVGTGVPVYPSELLEATLTVVVAVSGAATAALEDLASAAEGLLDRLRESASVVAFLAGLPALARDGLVARWRRLRAWVARRLDRGEAPDPEAFEDAVDEVIADAATDDRTVTIEEAWERMVARLSVPNPDARTPGEYARWAVDNGMPPDAVRRLTDVFRDAEYGPNAPDERQEETARSAISHIEGGRPADGGEST